LSVKELEVLLGFRINRTTVEYLEFDENNKQTVRAVQPILHQRESAMWDMLVIQYNQIQQLKEESKARKDEVLKLRNVVAQNEAHRLEAVRQSIL
jgi:hypothetical protein